MGRESSRAGREVSRQLQCVEEELAVMTAEQILAKLNDLRKDYADDPDDETGRALHHAFLFISYQMAAFKDYVKEAAGKVK
ncbi:MAG: hypothetical protein U0791_27195 [Gemmataceae bacterium]